MERSNLRIIDIGEEEFHAKGTENIFSKMTKERLSNPDNRIVCPGTWCSQDSKRTVMLHYSQNQAYRTKDLKRERRATAHKGGPIRCLFQSVLPMGVTFFGTTIFSFIVSSAGKFWDVARSFKCYLLHVKILTHLSGERAADLKRVFLWREVCKYCEKSTNDPGAVHRPQTHRQRGMGPHAKAASLTVWGGACKRWMLNTAAASSTCHGIFATLDRTGLCDMWAFRGLLHPKSTVWYSVDIVHLKTQADTSLTSSQTSVASSWLSALETTPQALAWRPPAPGILNIQGSSVPCSPA